MKFQHLRNTIYNPKDVKSWRWLTAKGDGNCYWHACSTMMRSPWREIKSSALRHTQDALLAEQCPKLDLQEIQSLHAADGYFADEVMLLATAVAYQARILVVDVQNTMLYDIQAENPMMCLIFRLEGQHYVPLMEEQRKDFVSWVDDGDWAWAQMFQSNKQPRLKGGHQARSHSLSSIRLRPFRSGLMAVKWHEQAHDDDIEYKPMPDKITLKAVNAQGLRTSLASILLESPDICICSETNVPQADIRELDEACKEQDYAAVHKVAQYAGVSLLVKRPLTVVEPYSTTPTARMGPSRTPNCCTSAEQWG